MSVTERPEALSVKVVGNTVVVRNLVVQEDPYLLALLGSVDPSNQDDVVRRALGIGARVLVDEINAQTLAEIHREQQELAARGRELNQTVAGLSQAIQAAVEAMFQAYFKGEDGKVPAALTRRAEVMTRGMDERIRELGTRFNPADATSWTVAVRDTTVQAVRQLLAEFAGSLSQDGEGGPLARVFANEVQMREMLTQLEVKIDSLSQALAARHARAGTTQRGSDYEALAFQALSVEADRFADTAARVGKRAGHAGTQEGDLLLEINRDDATGLDLRVVFEVRNRDMSRPDPRAVLEELDRAMVNHGAQAAVLVVSSPDFMPADAKGRPFKAYGGNRFAVVLDPDGTEPGFFWVAYQVARALVRSGARIDREVEAAETIDVDRVLELVGAIEGQLQVIHHARTSLRAIRSTAKTAYDALGGFEGEVAGFIHELRALLS